MTLKELSDLSQQLQVATAELKDAIHDVSYGMEPDEELTRRQSDDIRRIWHGIYEPVYHLQFVGR